MIIVYDVETSGLPDWKKPSNDPSQPHITQIAAILADDAGIEQERINVFIKPDGWTLPEEIVKITGVTQETHNESFDCRLLRIEMARLFGKIDLLEEWKVFPAFCTMVKSTHVINLPPTEKMVKAGFNKPKSPKLEEAYEFYFGKKPDKSHDAMADVESTLAIYLKLITPKEAA